MDWSGGAPLYENPNSVAFTSCWLYSASPINSLCIVLALEDASLTIQHLGNRYPLPPWHSSTCGGDCRSHLSRVRRRSHRRRGAYGDFVNFKMIVLVYSILCTATKAERKTRELRIYLRCRFTHFAPYVLRLGVV